MRLSRVENEGEGGGFERTHFELSPRSRSNQEGEDDAGEEQGGRDAGEAESEDSSGEEGRFSESIHEVLLARNDDGE